MMKFKQSVIEGVVEKLRGYFDIDVEFGNALFTVHTESSKAISEFESRLVAAQMKDDGEWGINGEEDGNIEILLNELVNLVDTREFIGPLVNAGGSWRARYLTIPYED